MLARSAGSRLGASTPLCVAPVLPFRRGGGRDVFDEAYTRCADVELLPTLAVSATVALVHVPVILLCDVLFVINRGSASVGGM